MQDIEHEVIHKGGRDVHADEWAKEDLVVRKKYELKLMRKFDKTKINTGKECWFLVDCMWLNRWSEFVNTDSTEPPGPISSADLLDENRNPLVGLKARQDYRALGPISYFILKGLHGSDGSPDIPRYSLDIYKPAVPVERLVSIQMTAVCEANVQINKYRSKWMTWEIAFEEDEVPTNFWCCGLTKEHLEAFIYWAVHCWRWSRKSSGRETVKYRQYRPLKGIPDDTIHGGSQHGGSQRGGSQLGDSQHGGSQRGGNQIGGSQHGGSDFGSWHGGGDMDEATLNALHSSSEPEGMEMVGRSRSNTATSRKSEGTGVGRFMQSRGGGRDAQGEGDEDDCVDEDSSSDDDEMHDGPADRNHHKGQWLKEMIR